MAKAPVKERDIGPKRSLARWCAVSRMQFAQRPVQHQTQEHEYRLRHDRQATKIR